MRQRESKVVKFCAPDVPEVHYTFILPQLGCSTLPWISCNTLLSFQRDDLILKLELSLSLSVKRILTDMNSLRRQ